MVMASLNILFKDANPHNVYLAAKKPIMIPKLHYISKSGTSHEQLVHIQSACSSGIELIQLHLEGIKPKKQQAFAEEARTITAHFQTRLVICEDYKLAKAIKADGIYLKKRGSCPIAARTHAFTWQSIGGEAQTLEDCETLLEKQVDYIGLGPFKTSTIDTRTALGQTGYALIAEALQTETPLLGFGEITTVDVKALLQTGVSGILVSKAITEDYNRIKTFHQLLQASSTEEQRHTFK